MRSGRVLGGAGSVGGSVLLLAGALLMAAPGVAASGGSTFYVSPTGASGGADTSCATAAYSQINDAVSAASAGDTVVVCAGTYTEDVAVAKALTLTTSGAVIIDATGLDNGILITASDVTVSGFTVENAVGEGILAHGTPAPGPVVNGQPTSTGTPLTHVVIKHTVVQNNDQGAPTSPYKPCQPSNGVPGDCGEGIHLMSVADSDVLLNTITGNSGGILITDEFGPTYGNLFAGNVVTDNATFCGITLASHNGLAINPKTLKTTPTLAGVYDNVVRNNILLNNGLKSGGGSGLGIFAAFPGTADYNNTLLDNSVAASGNGGVSMHAHGPGAFIGGNRILGNVIGPNNLDGDHETTPADLASTGIVVWSAATPITITITGNTIFGNTYGIWINAVVSAPGAATNNTFWTVGTHVYKA